MHFYSDLLPVSFFQSLSITDQCCSIILASGPLCPLFPESSSLSWPNEFRFLRVLCLTSPLPGSLPGSLKEPPPAQEESQNIEITDFGFDKSLLPRALPKTWSQEASGDIYELKKQRYRDKNATETEVRQGRDRDREEGQRRKGMNEGWPGDQSQIS